MKTSHKIIDYHYTESGLDNVYLQNTPLYIDEEGDEVVELANIKGLHRQISIGLIHKSSGLNGNEIRFLRTEMGLTQAQLANKLHCEPLTISRWERSETDVDPKADVIIRLLGLAHYKSTEKMDIEHILSLATPMKRDYCLKIEANKQNKYSYLWSEAA
jgi:transcriptional regulator with XRE-family HTH domain